MKTKLEVFGVGRRRREAGGSDAGQRFSETNEGGHGRWREWAIVVDYIPLMVGLFTSSLMVLRHFDLTANALGQPFAIAVNEYPPMEKADC
jgi:hypothetical protein